MSINIIDEKMTRINNAIRSINDDTDLLGLDAMGEILEDNDSQITEQESIIEQLQSSLQGKAASGGYTEEPNEFGGTTLIIG